MTRLNLALSINYTRISSPNTSSHVYAKPDPSATATSLPIASATSTAVSDVERTHTHAGLHACMHLVRVVRRHTYIHMSMSMLRTCCTYVPKSASFVTTARAESERADRTTEKHGCLLSSAIPPSRHYDGDSNGLFVCLSNLSYAFSPLRHLATLQSGERTTTAR